MRSSADQQAIAVMDGLLLVLVGDGLRDRGLIR